MLFSRRSLILSSVALSVGGSAFAIPPGIGQEPALPLREGETVPTLAQLMEESKNLGIGTPKKEEIDTALDILNNAPLGVNPVEVADYFAQVGLGSQGIARKPYIQEWPIRANPLITAFFDSLGFKFYSGDCTAWCSAFVTWCLQHSRLGRSDTQSLQPLPVKNPGSSYYRGWLETKTPQTGDLVVFQDGGPTSVTGHVGFFLKFEKSKLGTPGVWVLGGNQNVGKDAQRIKQEGGSNCPAGGQGGKICHAWLPIDGESLKVMRYVTDAGLRDQPWSNGALKRLTGDCKLC